MKTKAHLVLPREILEEVDKIAGKRRRSLFIAEATKEKLAATSIVNDLILVTYNKKHYPIRGLRFHSLPPL